MVFQLDSLLSEKVRMSFSFTFFFRSAKIAPYNSLVASFNVHFKTVKN